MCVVCMCMCVWCACACVCGVDVCACAFACSVCVCVSVCTCVCVRACMAMSVCVCVLNILLFSLDHPQDKTIPIRSLVISTTFAVGIIVVFPNMTVCKIWFHMQM